MAFSAAAPRTIMLLIGSFSPSSLSETLRSGPFMGVSPASVQRAFSAAARNSAAASSSGRSVYTMPRRSPPARM